jgi:putative DNA primase/helicase
MTERIFLEHAPLYWAKGLPAIPLKQGDKMPLIDGWSTFCARMPTLGEQEYWLKAYPFSNIGMALGAQSDLFMIDIDTVDEKLMKTILEVLGGFMSPWQRVGAKGMVLAYRQPLNGVPLRTFQIKKSDNSMIVEGLSGGRQVVLPPSIHPTTKKPYVANAELIDLYDELPRIPSGVEGMLRQALQDQGVELSHSGWTRVTDFVASGSRDTQMTRVAGLWAQGVTRGEVSLLEAIERMRIWHETRVEKVAGDEVDLNKGVSNLVGFLTRDVLEYKKTLPKGWDTALTDEMKKGLGLNFSNEHEEWSYDQIINYLQAEFEKHPAMSSGRVATVEYVLERMSRSNNLTGVFENQILKWISESSGQRMSVSVLSKRLKEMKQGDLKGQDHTEIAKAALEEISQYGELRFHHSKFWQWGGSHWDEKDKDELLRVIADKFGSLGAARRRSDHNGILQVMGTLIRKELKIDTRNGINFANGFLTEEMQLLPHDPVYGCTYTLPYRYLPEEADGGKQWAQFLERMWIGDPDISEKKMALQEAMAVTLFGVGTRYSRAILCYGRAGTGKSQLLKVIEAMLPANMRAALSPEDWSDKFGPSHLADKLLNIAGELHEHHKITSKWFKSIISGDTINAQFKGRDLFEFTPIATHWFASNHLPKSADTTAGFNRRWLVLTFNHPISKAERIVDIANRMVADEREQIIAWAVQGMTRLLRNTDYTLPSSHDEAIKEVANQNDSVRFWLNTSTTVKIGPFVAEVSGSKTSPLTLETKLYDAYSSFCVAQAGVRPAILKNFQQKMKDIGEDLGFRKRMMPTANGLEEGAWENLTLVGAAAR